MKITKKSSGVSIDLAKVVSQDTLAKLYFLCKERKLAFPDGVVFLLEEVSEPLRNEDVRRATGKSDLRLRKNLSCKGKVS